MEGGNKYKIFMNNSINTLPEQRKLEELINNKINTIFDEENWVKKDLWKIAEVTYSYDSDTKVNTTLFEKAWWLDLELYKKSNKQTREKLLLEAKEELLISLNEKKAIIEKALSEVKEVVIENSFETDIIEIFINSLEEKESFINYCIKSLPFEIEKTWINLWLSKEEEKAIEEEIEVYDKILFWWKIKDNPEEVKLSYEYILEKYNFKKNILTSEEQKRFEWYLNLIIKWENNKSYLPEWYKYISKKRPKQINWDFLNIQIPRKDYMLWFNILVEAHEKLEHIVETNDSAKSISDWPNWVQFPIWEKFEYMNILRFSKLSNHEIETHNVTDYNWKQIISNMRWAKSTEKDEWVAMLMEQLFMYWEELYKDDIDINWKKIRIIDINKIQINSYFTKTLMWELLDNEKLVDFLELSEKIDPDVISAQDRYERLKRSNKLWVQHKDTTYTRWLLKAIEEINKYIKSSWKEGISPEDLFLWKISFKETKKLKNIKEAREKSGEKINIIKPLFISDAVYFILNEKLKGEEWNITWWKFLKYLKNKYPMFNFFKEQIKVLSEKTKNNVYWIVNIMLKNIDKNNIENIYSNHWKYNNKIKKLLKWTIIENQYNRKIQPIKHKMHPNRKNAK